MVGFDEQNQLVPEFSSHVAPPTSRDARITEEDEALSKSPEQRKITLLDYVRRGRLTDGVELMPELIDSLPKIFKQQGIDDIPVLIDFNAEDYSFEGVVEALFAVFSEIESEVKEDDKIYTEKLKSLGLNVRDDVYWDKKRYGSILIAAQNYLSTITPENLAKVRAEDPIGIKRKGGVGKLKSIGLFTNSDEEFVSFLERIEAQPDLVKENDIEQVPKQEAETLKSIILKLVRGVETIDSKYNPSRDGFAKTESLDNYKGEFFDPKEIDLDSVRQRPGLAVIKRGDLVPVRGTGHKGESLYGITLIDGNLGYEENGDIREEEGISIIDHHDQLEKKYKGKNYDTATVMMTRIISDELKSAGWNPKGKRDEKWRKGLRSYFDKYGARVEDDETKSDRRKMRVCVNHLDSDSVLSVWAYRNPRMAMEHKEILTKISTCGDFLLGSGVLDHGATARDYEYIIRNYIEACSQSAKEIRTEPLEQEIGEIGKEISSLLGQYDSGTAVEDPNAYFKQLISIEEAGDEVLVALKQEMQKAQGADKRVVAEKIREAKAQNLKIRELEEASKRGGELVKEKARLQKEFIALSKAGLSPEENTKILNYLLNNMDDVIKNPFKYKVFLEKG